MSRDPSTGPVPREQFFALVNAPFGEAAKKIRKFAPMFGRADGEKITWRVECTGTMTGTAFVEACSEEEAVEAADNLTAADVDWDGGSDDIEVQNVTVEP